MWTEFVVQEFWSIFKLFTYVYPSANSGQADEMRHRWIPACSFNCFQTQAIRYTWLQRTVILYCLYLISFYASPSSNSFHSQYLSTCFHSSLIFLFHPILTFRFPVTPFSIFLSSYPTWLSPPGLYSFLSFSSFISSVSVILLLVLLLLLYILFFLLHIVLFLVLSTLTSRIVGLESQRANLSSLLHLLLHIFFALFFSTAAPSVTLMRHIQHSGHRFKVCRGHLELTAEKINSVGYWLLLIRYVPS